jgi:group I intron endonuclease
MMTERQLENLHVVLRANEVWSKAVERLCGIYIIRNTSNGRVYIGSAVDHIVRWHHHRLALRKGIHHSCLLQRSWNKYGAETFVFEFIERTDRSDRIGREQFWLSKLRTFESSRGFNISPTAAGQLGTKRQVESRARMSAAALGKKKRFSKDHLDFIRQRNKARGITPENRAKMVAAQKGLKRGPPSFETRQKIGKANKGKHSQRQSRAWVDARMKGMRQSRNRKIGQLELNF